jgi:hypothetical protein
VKKDRDVDLADLTRDPIEGDDGIWHGPGIAAVAYQEDGSVAVAALDASSIWFDHRLIAGAVRRMVLPGACVSISVEAMAASRARWCVRATYR